MPGSHISVSLGDGGVGGAESGVYSCCPPVPPSGTYISKGAQVDRAFTWPLS